MPANTEIFFEHSGLSRPLAWSLGLHVAFTGFVIVLGLILHGRTGAGWGAGGGGEAIGVSLVSNIPLPASQVQTQNVLANDSKGITESKPAGKRERARCHPDSRQEHEDQAEAPKYGKPSESAASARSQKPTTCLSAKAARSADPTVLSARPELKADLVFREVAVISVLPTHGTCGSCSKKYRKTGLGTRSIPVFTRPIGCMSCSTSADPGTRGMCRSSSRVVCHRSISPPYAPFSELTHSVHCRPTTLAARSPWSFGSTIRGRPQALPESGASHIPSEGVGCTSYSRVPHFVLVTPSA